MIHEAGSLFIVTPEIVVEVAQVDSRGEERNNQP